MTLPNQQDSPKEYIRKNQAKENRIMFSPTDLEEETEEEMVVNSIPLEIQQQQITRHPVIKSPMVSRNRMTIEQPKLVHTTKVTPPVVSPFVATSEGHLRPTRLFQNDPVLFNPPPPKYDIASSKQHAPVVDFIKHAKASQIIPPLPFAPSDFTCTDIDKYLSKMNFIFGNREEMKSQQFVAEMNKLKVRYQDELERLNTLHRQYVEQLNGLLHTQKFLRPVTEDELLYKVATLNVKFNALSKALLQKVCYAILQLYQSIRGESKVSTSDISELYHRCFSEQYR